MKAKIDCPYPGLRPFQEHESAFFFGREGQIGEIVNRLKNSRFVAVLGGSGSGKSSLVLAGAIPELRAEAIEGAGDFWVPVIATPGTNPKNSSPITRMAEKFCSLLEPIFDEEIRNDRLEDCISLLRTPNGLSLLINKYGRTLGEKHRDGVDLQLASSNGEVETDVQSDYLVKVNFLFLIDQFEELFHPSNDQVKEDCLHLVERIVDHFKQCRLGEDGNQSTRLCVAITMRSEHLNDCTRYADLPDAINAAVYLVKRLTREEIVEAIVKPVDAFLRQQFRQAVWEARKEGGVAPDKKSWPKEIKFSPDVIDRLMLDTDSIVTQQDHADLLPLLQHLLYWIWVCAVVRTRAQSMDDHCYSCLPDAITREDLDAALTPYDLRITPQRLGAESSPYRDRSSWFNFLTRDANIKSTVSSIEEDCNALTACLEKRCEWIFLRRENDSVRICWEKIFPNLAFKDPNTGTYTQRRVDIRDLCQRHGSYFSTDTDIENQIKQLKQHLQPWLGEELGYHQYLYWDKGSETLKVTHESLIRRWKRFREWIDWKDRQFMEYVQALENCSHWQQDGKKWGDLISDGVILGRIKEYGLREALKNEGLRTQFTDLLKLHRDKLRLTEGCDNLEEFLNGSFNKRYWKFSIYGSVILLLFSLYIALNSSIESRFKEKKTNLLSAISIAAETRLPPPTVIEKYEQEQIALRNLLAAVGLKNRPLPSYWYDLIYKVADFDFFYDDEREKEYRNWLWSESKTLGGLRSALLGRAWRPKPSSYPNELSKSNKPANVDCKSVDIEGTKEYEGSIGNFFEKEQGYGLLRVTVVGQKTSFGTQVFWAKQGPDGVCRSHIGQQVWWAGKDSSLGFVAGQNYLVEFQDKTTTIVAIDWPINALPVDQQPLATPQKYILDNKDKEIDLLLTGQESDQLVLMNNRIDEDDAFFEDIQIGQTWYRFFNRGSALTTKAPEGEEAVLVSEGKPSIGQHAEGAIVTTPVIEGSDTCRHWLNKAQTIGNAQTWQINHENEVLCLVVNDAEVAKGMYYADLYQVRVNDEDHLPLISGMSFGSELPKAIKVDFKKGWLYFALGNKALDNKWFQQPWSSGAWVKLAAAIDLPLPFSESMKNIESESRYTKFQWHLKDKDFNLDDLAAQAICGSIPESHFCKKDKKLLETEQ